MADTDLQTAVVHKLLMLVLDQSISNFYFQIKELLVRVIHMTVVVLDFHESMNYANWYGISENS